MSEGQRQDNHIYAEYTAKIHRMGRILTTIAIAFMFLPAVGIVIKYNIGIDWTTTLAGMGKVLMVFGVIGVSEFLSFTPLLGPGGSYLGFITGNIVPMKLPCVTSALKIVNAKPGTKEADIVSILAVGTSSIVSIVICALGMCLISLLYPILSSEVLSPGFSNMVPALIGAMSAPYLVKNPRMTSFPMVVGIILTLCVGVPFIKEYDSLFNILFIIFTVGWAYLLYRKGRITEEKS